MAGPTGRVVVVGLGPGGPELVDRRTEALLASVGPRARFARTDRHPSAVVLGEHRGFDDIYQSAASLEEVYRTIVGTLVDEARRQGVVVYAVPGSPLVAERTVELLRADPRVEVDVVPCLSFLDLAWARLGVDPLAAGVRLVDGQRFAVEAAGRQGPLLVAQCDSLDVLSEVKLAVDVSPGERVVVLQRLGLADEAVFAVDWDDLDRRVRPDHLTSLWVPSLAAPVAAELVRFGELVGILRRRCPWDREQTHGSLRRYLVEEAYEVLDVVDRLERLGVGGEPAAEPASPDADLGPGDDLVEELCDELGDLLFQIIFHAEIASEQGWFTLADVARGIHDKLVRRHPHVFGDVVAADAGTVVRNWDQIKGDERAAKAGDTPAGYFDGVPRALPALAYAAKVQRRAPAGEALPSGQGSDWADVAHRLDRLAASAGPAERATQLGDLLFALVGVARTLGADAEEALRLATERFRQRVDEVAGRQGNLR